MRFQDMDAWSQAMIDGIANYTGNKEVEARCHAATAGIDAAIDDMIPVVTKHPNSSILSVLLAAGQPIDSIRANIKLAISGGQNEPRDAIAGTVWALLTHPEQLALVRDGKAKWLDVFEEYARWIAPIQMSPRRVAKPWSYGGVDFEPEDRVFFMFGSANRDEACFADPDQLRRHPQYPEEHRLRRRPALLRRRVCLARDGRRRGAAGRLRAVEGLAARRREPVRIGGWAFRGLLNLPVIVGRAIASVMRIVTAPGRLGVHGLVPQLAERSLHGISWINWNSQRMAQVPGNSPPAAPQIAQDDEIDDIDTIRSTTASRRSTAPRRR